MPRLDPRAQRTQGSLAQRAVNGDPEARAAFDEGTLRWLLSGDAGSQQRKVTRWEGGYRPRSNVIDLRDTRLPSRQALQ